MKQKKIGIVTTWFERGASYVSRQYMDLLGEKHNVFIYARGGESYAKESPHWNLNNVHWGKKTFFSINGTPVDKKDFTFWLEKNEIEILFFNEQQWWPPVVWARELDIVVGSYIDYYTKETVPLFEVFDFLICNTKKHYEAFKWHKNCFYLPWGTDVNLFSYDPIKRGKVNELVFFNSCGMNPERKGVKPLLVAFSKIKNQNVKLLIHTQVDLFKYYKDLSPLIKDLLKENKLELINETISAPGLYFKADIYCYLSKLDGIGLTLPEAISSGLPSIVPDNGPMYEFVEEGVNGRKVKISRLYYREDNYYWPQCDVDSDSLLEAMQFYVDNFDKIEDFKQSSREYALQNLNWLDRAPELNRIFENATIQIVEKDTFELIHRFEKNRIKQNAVNFKLIFSMIYKNFRR